MLHTPKINILIINAVQTSVQKCLYAIILPIIVNGTNTIINTTNITILAIQYPNKILYTFYLIILFFSNTFRRKISL